MYDDSRKASVLTALSIHREQYETPGKLMEKLCENPNYNLPYSQPHDTEIDGGPLSIKEISEVADLSEPLIKGYLDMLEETDLVVCRERKIKDEDTGVNEYYMTDEMLAKHILYLLNIEKRYKF